MAINEEYCEPCAKCEEGEGTNMDEICDGISGKCVCKMGFAEPYCNKCSSGFYSYPDCNSCGCVLYGSLGSTCTDEGKCTCKNDKFIGPKCGQCKSDEYDYPYCDHRKLHNIKKDKKLVPIIYCVLFLQLHSL